MNFDWEKALNLLTLYAVLVGLAFIYWRWCLLIGR